MKKLYLLGILVLFICGVVVINTPSYVRIGDYMILEKTPIDSIQSPEEGSMAFNMDNKMYYYNGSEWSTLDNTECCNKVKFGEFPFGGEPSQSVFITVFGEQSYPFQFTLRSSWDNKAYQGAYLPDHGFYFEKLKWN